MSTLISIIIPTKNEQANIDRCLSSIISNGYPDYEIIVVDQSSTDQTVAIAKRYHAKIINVLPTKKYIPPSQSRNLGFKHSLGDIIYHVDADMELEKGLLAEISDMFSNPQTSALVIPEADIPTNFWAKGKAFERSLYQNTDMEAARATTRSIFSQVLYDKNITSGEDWYIHARYKKLGKINRTSKKVYHHIGSISLAREFKKKLHYGTESGNYLSQQSSDLKPRFIKLIGIYLSGIFLHLFNSPSSVFSFLIIRVVDTLALIAGLIIYKKP